MSALYWLRHPSFYSPGGGVKTTSRHKRTKVQLRILPTSKAVLIELAAAEGVTMSRMVELLILRASIADDDSTPRAES